MRGRGSISGVATFLAGFAVIAVVAYADGGYFSDTWGWTTLALACLIWIDVLVRDTIVLGRLELIGIAALVSFVAWVALSATWSPTPTETFEEAERGLVYAGGFVACALVVDRDRLRAYLSGIAVAIVLVVAYGLGDRLLGAPPARDRTQGTLLIEPFGYANALGIFTTLGMLLAIGLAASTSSRAERSLWVATIPLLGLALVSTESRGAWLALGMGICVLTTLRWARVGAPLPVPKPVLVAIVTGFLMLVVAGAVLADRPLGPRVDYWTVALQQWRESIFLGSGAGTFALYWLREGSTSVVLDAHSLYLETLAEVGPIGLLLLLCALGVPLLAALRARDHPLTAVGAGAYAAYLVHAGLDWDWEMPAVTLAGLLCGVGVLVAGRGSGTDITLGAQGRGAFALLALFMAGVGAAGAVTH